MREEGSGWGTHVYLWQIHFDIWQNQYNIVKLNKIKLNLKIKKEEIMKYFEINKNKNTTFKNLEKKKTKLRDTAKSVLKGNFRVRKVYLKK